MQIFVNTVCFLNLASFLILEILSIQIKKIFNMSKIYLDFVLVYKTGRKQLIGQNHTLMLIDTEYKAGMGHILAIITAFKID